MGGNFQTTCLMTTYTNPQKHQKQGNYCDQDTSIPQSTTLRCTERPLDAPVKSNCKDCYYYHHVIVWMFILWSLLHSFSGFSFSADDFHSDCNSLLHLGGLCLSLYLCWSMSSFFQLSNNRHLMYHPKDHRAYAQSISVADISSKPL